MSDVALAMLVRPILVVIFAAFLLTIRRWVMRRVPEGRLKNILLIHVWDTDWEKAAKIRAGILPPEKTFSERCLSAGNWIRKIFR